MIKNVIAYAVTPGFKLDAELLRRQTATECGASQAHSEGFTAPCPHSTAELVHQVAGYTLICWQTEDKILPSSVVEEVVAAKAAEIEETQGYKVGRKQRRELKEQTVDELLPRAFVQKRKTLALFGGGYLIVNTSSKARAQGLIECLRKALEGVPLKGLRLNHAPSNVMAGWLASGEPPESLTIDRDCELQSADESKVKYVRKDVDTDEVRSLIADGYRPTKLAMTYADRISFVLGEELAITKLSLLDVIRTEAQADSDTAAEQFDVDVTLEGGEIVRLLDHLVESLGGLRVDESDNEELPLKEAA